MFVNPVEEFILGTTPEPAPAQRSLATVVFTDVVSSTRLASEMGEKQWTEALASLDELSAATIARYGVRLAELEAFLEWREAHVLAPASRPAGCLVVNTMSELAGRKPDVRQYCDNYRAIQREALSVAIDRAVAQGDLTPGDTATRSALLLAAHIGTGATARSTDSTDEALAMAKGMRQLICSWAPHAD